MYLNTQQIIQEGEGITIDFKRAPNQLPAKLFETLCTFPAGFGFRKWGCKAGKKNEPFSKKPHIAQIFTQMGRSEELGTRIRKVNKYAKAYAGFDKIELLEQGVFVTKMPLYFLCKYTHSHIL